MKIIVGLGNPGKRYEKTRHNVGFLVLDQVASKLGVSISTNKFKALITETFVNTEKVILVKPQTYMNLSGESVLSIMDYFNANIEDLLIISDDLDLQVGQLRLRDKGSSGGQKGIQSIINLMGSQEFLRLRIGIGNNKLIDTKDFVLGKIDDTMPIERATQCVMDYIDGMSTLDLMNIYNVKKI